MPVVLGCGQMWFCRTDSMFRSLLLYMSFRIVMHLQRRR